MFCEASKAHSMRLYDVEEVEVALSRSIVRYHYQHYADSLLWNFVTFEKKNISHDPLSRKNG